MSIWKKIIPISTVLILGGSALGVANAGITAALPQPQAVIQPQQQDQIRATESKISDIKLPAATTEAETPEVVKPTPIKPVQTPAKVQAGQKTMHRQQLHVNEQQHINQQQHLNQEQHMNQQHQNQQQHRNQAWHNAGNGNR